MSFSERISVLAQRLPDVVEHLETEEATKNALVMPFLAALGYDVFDPKEVVPEFTADVGLKKGEKVDYAIKRDEEIIILVECKKAGIDLGDAQTSQLYRYFSVTKARIAVLTNGVRYQFYSDLEEPNKMDRLPFLTLDLTDPREDLLAEVKKLSKEQFDLERMLSTANELKFLFEIKRILKQQLDEPEEELVRFFFGRVNPGSRFTTALKEQFTALVAKGLNQFIGERVSDRLRTALEREDVSLGRRSDPDHDAEDADEPRDDGIVTTEEEIEGYHVVRAIVSEVVPPERVVHRDTKSYMGILLDDNNRKPICRLHFNRSQKYLGLFDEQKTEDRVPIDSLDQIYAYADRLRYIARHWSAQ